MPAALLPLLILYKPLLHTSNLASGKGGLFQ